MKKKIFIILLSIICFNKVLAMDVFCQCEENTNDVGVSLLFYLSGTKNLKLPAKSIKLADDFYKSKPILELYPSLKSSLQQRLENKKLPKPLLESAQRKLEKKDSTYYFTNSLTCKKIKKFINEKKRPIRCVKLFKLL